MQENQPERARKRFETVLEAKPGNSRAMLAKANFLSAQGAPRSEVQGLIEGAVKAAAQDIDARVALVAFHFDARNFDAALSSAQAAVDAVPDNVELLELLARCQMRKNDNNQALRSYARVVTLLPGSPRGYVGTADVYLAMGDLDAAQRNIDRALQLVPGHPESRAQAIMVALTRKQPDAALGIARRMQAERAADATGWILEGEIESRRGRWDAAAAALRQALDKTGADTVPLKLHAALVRGGKTSEAATFAAAWLKGHPRDAAFLFHLGDVAQVSGDLAGAEKRYQEALVADPDHVPSLNNLAALHTQQKKPDAVALAERAVRRAPEQPVLLDTLAAAYAANNDMPKAIKVQTQAVALAPDEGMLRLALARLYLQADSKAQAKYQLEELARMGQRFAEQGEVAKLLATLVGTAASQ